MSILTFPEFKDFICRFDLGNVTPEEIKICWERLKNSQKELKVELMTWKKAELNKYVRHPGNKPQLVEWLIDDMMKEFWVGNVQYWMDEDVWEVCEKQLNKWTAETIAEKAAKHKAAMEAREERIKGYKKALENPETLEEFDFFVQVHKKGIEALSIEQLVVYDRLLAEKGRTRRQTERERNATIKAVEVDAELSLIETIHTKKGIPLWVIQLSNRVSHAKYKEMEARAHKLGGRYSGYKGNGAIPGFTFRSKENAEAFLKLERIEGEEIVKRREERREEKAVDKLLAIAQAWKEDAQERLSRERLANTVRRARIASQCERDACIDFQLAQTIKRIAVAIEGKELKFISRLYNATEFKDLESLLSQARWEAYRKLSDNMPYQQREAERTRSPQLSDIEYAVFPYPLVRQSAISTLIEAGEKRNGCKQLAAKLKKIAIRPNHSDWGYKFTSESDIEVLRSLMKRLPSNYGYLESAIENVKNELLQYDRMIRLDIYNIHELPTALREYLEYRGKKKEPDFNKSLDRSLIGLKIDGYFPTPKSVVEGKMLPEAQIESHHLCLEPNVGGKAILGEAIRNIVGNDNLHCCEISYTLYEVAQKKGFNMVERDFFDYNPGAIYDRILLNPPFEHHQDMAHLIHAYDLLKDDGIMVAVIGASTAGYEPFIHWLDSVEGWKQKLPEKSFMSSDRPVGVQTWLVVIEKQYSNVEVESEPLNLTPIETEIVENANLIEPVQLSIFEKENANYVQLALF